MHLYRADLDRNGIQDLVIWLLKSGFGHGGAQYIIFHLSPEWPPASFEPWGLYRDVLASMICLIYRAMGAHGW